MWLKPVAVLALLFTVSLANAQDTSPRVGNRVVLTYPATLRTSKRAVQPIDWRVYTVRKVRGERVLIVSGGLSGWVRSGGVVRGDQAIEWFTRGITAFPLSAGNYNCRGLVWDSLEEYDRAIADYNEAIRLDPWSAITYTNRGYAWCSKKEYDEAIADYNESIRLDPRCVLAFLNRGVAWQNKHEYYKAHDDFKMAIRLKPRFPRAHCRLALLYATCPDPKFRDGKLAIESATRACELCLWNEASSIASLAAAHATSGDFEKAVEYQTRSNGLMESDEQWTKAEERAKGQENLELYRNKKPAQEEGLPSTW